MSLKLEDYIAEGDASTRFIAYPRTTISMIKTGFHEWGFVIYRCVYGDDAAWQQYMKYFEEDVIDGLKHQGGDVSLPQYARWTVIEDRETLGGASVDVVREKFAEWREGRMFELEVPFEKRLIPMAKDPPPRLPRFNYCLYVDQKCLNTVAAFAELFPQAHFWDPIPPPLVAVLIDGDFDEREYKRGGYRDKPHERGTFPPVGGRTCRYVGWEYIDVHVMGGMYDALHYERLDEWMNYKRPPNVYPLGFHEMTDNGLERI